MKIPDVIALFSVCFLLVCIANGKSATKTPPPPPTTPSLSPLQVCANANYSCDTCVAKAECMWCSTATSKCKPYPVGKVIPGHDDCADLGDARWGVCWLNFKALIITMAVIAGVLLISTCCCIYCCCCRGKGNKKKYQKEEERWEREREERQQRAEERKEERKTRADEIRKKYGLIKDDNPYQRFDA